MEIFLTSKYFEKMLPKTTTCKKITGENFQIESAHVDHLKVTEGHHGDDLPGVAWKTDSMKPLQPVELKFKLITQLYCLSRDYRKWKEINF